MLKLLPYIIKQASRNRVRSTLTVLGVTVAISIFAFLISLEQSMLDTIDQASENTLLIVSQRDQW